MSLVLSLIASPDNPVVDEKLLAAIADLAGAAPTTELAPAVAYDFALDRAPADPQRIAAVADEAGADVNILPAAGRRKALLVADMDSTIIRQECIDELADFAGKRAEISAITERAMRGELDFEAALRERVAMLEGLPQDVLEETFRTRITLTPGARLLVQTMNAFGARTALVSGGFTFFTARVAEETGFAFNQANELLLSGGTLAGRVREPILGREAKREALERHAREARIPLSETIAVGDGANDLAMMERSGLGVAFRAKPAVAAAAHARIKHGDLTALLYLQGYRRSEFAE